MKTNTVFLDQTYRRSLEQIAIAEGFITVDCDGNAIARPQYRKQHRQRTLLGVTLFDTIDYSWSEFDLSSLVSHGLIHQSANVLTQFYLDAACFSLAHAAEHTRTGTTASSTRTSSRSVARDAAFKLVRARRKQLISNYIRKHAQNEKRTELEQIFDHVIEWEDWTHFGPRDRYRNFVSDLETYFGDIEACVFLATENNSHCAISGKMPPSIKLNTSKIVEDTVYLARTKLTNETIYLPDPTTLAQALRIRESRYIKRFRDVFSEWCRTLALGDDQLEQKMRRDVQLANRSLKRLESWRKYEVSPLNIVINAIGGHVPILSNVLSLISTAAVITSQVVERKHGWTMIGLDAKAK